MKTSIEYAVEEAGGQCALARALTSDLGRQVRQSHVHSWVKRGFAPAQYLHAIERVTGESAHNQLLDAEASLNK